MSQQAEEKDDIRGDLMAAVSTIEQASPGSTGKMGDLAKSSAPPADATPASSPPPDKSGGAEVRDDKGRFKPTKDKSGIEAAEKPSAETPKPAEKPLDGVEPGADGKDAKASPDAAPGSLPGALKQKWAALDPDAKAYIRAQETKLSTLAGTHGDKIKQLETQLNEFEPVIGPRRGALTANYGSVGAAVKRMFDLSDFASQDPPGFVAWFAQQSGIDLHALIGQQSQAAPGQQPQTAVPPELMQRLNGLESKLQASERQAQESRLANDAAEIRAVYEETDAQGNYVRPFFEELRPQIGPLLSIVKKEHPEWSARQIAAAAYDKAVWMNDDVRSRVLAAKDQSEQQKKEAAARAEAAERARKSTGGDPPNRFTGGGESGSVRDEISKLVHASFAGGSRL